MHFLYQAGLKRQTPLAECIPPTIKLHLVSFPFIAAWGRLKPHSLRHWYSESSSRRKSEPSNFSLRANLTEGLFYYLCHFWTPPGFLQAPNIAITVRFFSTFLCDGSIFRSNFSLRDSSPGSILLRPPGCVHLICDAVLYPSEWNNFSLLSTTCYSSIFHLNFTFTLRQCFLNACPHWSQYTKQFSASLLSANGISSCFIMPRTLPQKQSFCSES